MVDPGLRSLPAVREAETFGSRLLRIKAAGVIVVGSAAIYAIPGPLQAVFWISALIMVALNALFSGVKTPIELLLAGFPSCRAFEAVDGDAGIRGDVRRAAVTAAERAGIRPPRTFVLVGWSGPIAFSRWDRDGGTVVINGNFAIARPGCLEPMVAHEVAHLALRHTPVMLRIGLLHAALYHLSAAALLCMGLWILFAIVGGLPWTSGVLACGGLALASRALAAWPKDPLPKLSHQHEYAADAAAAWIIDDIGRMAAALIVIAAAIPDDGSDDGPDTHPPVERRIERLIVLALETASENRKHRP